MNNSVFGKTMGNVRKYRDIILVTTEAKRNYLVSQPNYHTKKFLSKDLLAIELRKTDNIKIINIRNGLLEIINV